MAYDVALIIWVGPQRGKVALGRPAGAANLLERAHLGEVLGRRLEGHDRGIQSLASLVAACDGDAESGVHRCPPGALGLGMLEAGFAELGARAHESPSMLRSHATARLMSACFHPRPEKSARPPVPTPVVTIPERKTRASKSTVAMYCFGEKMTMHCVLASCSKLQPSGTSNVGLIAAPPAQSRSAVASEIDASATRGTVAPACA